MHKSIQNKTNQIKLISKNLDCEDGKFINQRRVNDILGKPLVLKHGSLFQLKTFCK